MHLLTSNNDNAESNSSPQGLHRLTFTATKSIIYYCIGTEWVRGKFFLGGSRSMMFISYYSWSIYKWWYMYSFYFCFRKRVFWLLNSLPHQYIHLLGDEQLIPHQTPQILIKCLPHTVDSNTQMFDQWLQNKVSHFTTIAICSRKILLNY